MSGPSEFDLTPEQSRLVATAEGAYLVLAPPGSGKTEVLSRRITRLLDDDESTTSRLLALTFTRKAAREMQRRVEGLLIDSRHRATITTYHGFADMLLRQHGEPVGFTPETTIYSGKEDRYEALAEGLKNEGFDISRLTAADVSTILEMISRQKRELVPPESARGTIEAIGAPLGEVYAAYETALKDNAASDYDGLLVMAHALLAQHPGVAKYYSRLYRWILIDEAQDTCLAEYETLKALCGTAQRNVFMVADPDQAVFGFRGASVAYLDRFVTDFGAETVHLGANFRCAEELVRVSFSFLGNTNETPVRSHANAAGRVQAVSLRDEVAEAEWLSNWIEDLLVHGLRSEYLAPGEVNALAPHQIAVLARTRRLLEPLCAALESRSIEYVLATGGSNIFDVSDFRIAHYAIRVRANPADLALRRALISQLSIDVAPGSVGEDGVISFFLELQRATSGPIHEVCELLAVERDVTDFCNAIIDWRIEVVEGEGEEMADLVLRDLELLQTRVRFFS